MTLDIQSIELFIRIAALGAMGKAGREFGYSPTTASQRIQTLEEALGVKLLHRTTRRISLTADGELFLAHAKKITTGIEDALSDLQGGQTSLKGELRVTSSASFGRRYIAPHITEFLRLHPGVTINLELSDATFDIVRHGFDLAIRIGTLVPSTLMARKIADSPRIVCAAPSYIEEHGTPETASDLARHNCLTLGESRVWKLRDRDGRSSSVTIGGNFTTNYGEAITEASLCGAGIAIQSRWNIVDQLADGSLVELLADHVVEPEWRIWAVRPPGRLMSPRVRHFTDFIEEKVNREINNLN